MQKPRRQHQQLNGPHLRLDEGTVSDRESDGKGDNAGNKAGSVSDDCALINSGSLSGKGGHY